VLSRTFRLLIQPRDARCQRLRRGRGASSEPCFIVAIVSIAKAAGTVKIKDFAIFAGFAISWREPCRVESSPKRLCVLGALCGEFSHHRV
jgi:hypothetical protein